MNVQEAKDQLHKFHEFQKEARHQGIGLGDLIEKLIKYFGLHYLFNTPSGCGGCEWRKAVLNNLRIVGWHVNWERLKSLDNDKG